MSAQTAGDERKKNQTAQFAEAERVVGAFGLKLKELRAKYGISQARLAKGADVSPGYVGLIETGVRGDRPSLDVVKRFCNVLGATVEETEDLLRASGHLGPRERLIRDERDDLWDAISADPFLTQDQKDFLLRALEVMNYRGE